MTRNFTILYIEDDSDDLEVISEAFLKYTEELEVIHASNGQEGLETLEVLHEDGRSPCLVIIDINMPVLDGKTTLARIRADYRYKQLPIVLFSTSARLEDRQFAREHSASFFSKPQTYKDVQEIVRHFVSLCAFKENA